MKIIAAKDVATSLGGNFVTLKITKGIYGLGVPHYMDAKKLLPLISRIT